jgi:ubiquinone/menaquinone biosynthesis C-methylase UbiE
MRKHELRDFAEYYDQIYLKMNDYKNEARVVQNIIRRFERKPSGTLLDVGCGTGEHLKHLSKHFTCTGLDISREMIRKARKKVPNARFKVGDMIDFKLRRRFDVITCLFSSIGYVQNFRNLVRTLRNFHNHLADDGMVLVEPWVFRRDFRKGTVSIDTYEDKRTKLVRMGTSRLTKTHWLVYFHYLIGGDGRIRHTEETHRMISAEYEDYLKAFNMAGYSQIKFLGENDWTRSRGLFVAMK